MSNLIPQTTINTIRTFNDLAVKLLGISCTLFVPTNLTVLETNDMYIAPADIVYKSYPQQPIWIEWAIKDLYRLRKLGIFSEQEAPIIAWFKNEPEVILGSYVKIETRYIPDSYDTDEFEVVNVIMKNQYNSEIYRCFKMAPRRAKV